jgi:hypothetical protein
MQRGEATLVLKYALMDDTTVSHGLAILSVQTYTS